MGGASSFYAMLAVSAFLMAVWFAGKVSKLLGVSSIVLEVATGLILGPSVFKLIPGEISECYYNRNVVCDTYKDKLFIAEKGTEFCDLHAYLEADLYAPGKDWQEGFFGDESTVTLHGHEYHLGDHGAVAGVDHSGGPSDGNATTGVDHSGGPQGVHDTGHIDEEGTEEIVGTTVGPADSHSTAAGASAAHASTSTDEAAAHGALAPGGGHRRLSGGAEGQTKFPNYDECLESSCELDLALRCASTPDIFTLIGHTGVAMMIFESGMHFDFEQAKTVGPWACLVASVGTVFPILAGSLLAVIFGFPMVPDALAAGVSLAPTSVGIALKLLNEARALETYFGQAVMTAAFVDDVFSLILFSVLFSLGGDMSFMAFFPLIMGCVFMVVAIVAAVTVWPMFMKFLFSKIPEDKPGAKMTRHDEVMWMLMFITLCVYALITHLCGTHLWGCFIGGMSFATDHHAHHVWVRQVKRITCWFLRIFFACTLAWAIPVGDLFSFDAFWKGSLMGIGPCVLTKVFCAPFMGSARWVIGWAMVGRAEFAYFIAIMAKSLKMMDDKLFAILIWALIYATIFAPLIFRKVLKQYMAATFDDSAEPDIGKPSVPYIDDHDVDAKDQSDIEQMVTMKAENTHLKKMLKECRMSKDGLDLSNVEITIGKDEDDSGIPTVTRGGRNRTAPGACCAAPIGRHIWCS